MYFIRLRWNSSIRRKEWSFNSSRSLIISFNFWESFEISSNIPPESIVFTFTGIKGFEIVEIFSQHKIYDGKIAQSEVILSNKISNGIKLRPCLFKGVNFEIFIIFVPEKTTDLFVSILKDSKKIINSTSIFRILSKKISLSRSLSNISSNSHWFCELEISINKIREIGEVESKIELIFLEPLVRVIILNFFKFKAWVSHQQSDVLS